MACISLRIRCQTFTIGLLNVNMADQRGDGFIQFTLDYITKTWLGRLKCTEVIFSLLAGACGAGVLSWPGCNCVSKVSFSNFIAWTAFVNALIDMIIHLAGLWERLIWWFRHPALYLILCGVAVVGFLIGASLAASCATQTCVSNPGTAGAAAFFGFACLALFAAECCIHFQKYRSMQQEAQHQSSSGGKAPDFEEPPPPYSEAPGVIWVIECCLRVHFRLDHYAHLTFSLDI